MHGSKRVAMAIAATGSIWTRHGLCRGGETSFKPDICQAVQGEVMHHAEPRGYIISP